jgi:hypothetical protein
MKQAFSEGDIQGAEEDGEAGRRAGNRSECSVWVTGQWLRLHYQPPLSTRSQNANANRILTPLRSFAFQLESKFHPAKKPN